MGEVVRHGVRVRFRDVDAAQVVNNAVFLTYIEEARVAFFCDFLGPIQPTDLAIIQAGARVRHLSPIRLHDPVVVETRIPWMSERSLLMEHRLCHGDSGLAFAEASIPVVGHDRTADKVVAFPEDLRRRIAERCGPLGDPVKGFRVLHTPDPATWPAAGPEKAVDVRFADVDAFGHVNNATYLSYMEVARRHALLTWFPSRSGQFHFVIGETAINYLSPLYLDESVAIRVRPAALTAKTFTLEFFGAEARTRRPVFHARATSVGFDFMQRRSVPLPDWYAAGFPLENP